MTAILDASPTMVCVKDLYGSYLFVNQELAGLIGKPLEQVTGATDYD